jgi:hypothetical protein
LQAVKVTPTNDESAEGQSCLFRWIHNKNWNYGSFTKSYLMLRMPTYCNNFCQIPSSDISCSYTVKD